MRQQPVYDNNCLIAAFMGMKFHNHGSYTTFENEKGEHTYTSVLQYDSKWDWLMPVLQKISQLDRGVYGFEIRDTKAVIQDCYGVTDFHAEHSDGTCLINAYNCVIDFIQYYNAKTK